MDNGNLKGDDGKQGSSLLTGSGAPSAEVGDVEDLYLDTNTGDVYEKSADGCKKITTYKALLVHKVQKGRMVLLDQVVLAVLATMVEKRSPRSPSGHDNDGKGNSAQGG